LGEVWGILAFRAQKGRGLRNVRKGESLEGKARTATERKVSGERTDDVGGTDLWA